MTERIAKFSGLIITLLDWFHKPLRKIISAETFRYAAMGGLNSFLDIFLYFICYNFVLEKQMVNLQIMTISPHIASFVFVFPITFTSGFLASKYITFTGSELRGRIQLFRYGVAVGGSILLNYILLKLFVETFHIWPTYSKMLTTVFVVAYSYVIQRYYTFKTVNSRNYRETKSF